jgi:FG-GAP-like repeat/FG-GAP repeat
MAFAFTIQISDPNHFQQDAAVVADAQKAALDWGVYIGGLGSIDIQINIASTASMRASGGANAVVQWATDGSRIVYQNGTIAELVNGVDPNGSASDLTITIDPSYLQNELWLDPDPFNASAIPVNRTDAVSIFRHELGHAFGIEGYRSSSGTLPSGFETTWDRLVQINSDGSASFVGADATAAYGGVVPVTTLQNGEQYFHLGNGADAASSDLMNGIVFNRGVSYDISHLDVAILRDLGVPTTSASDLPASDFNGDGHGDLLWQNSDGTPAAWLLNGTSLVAGANIGFNPGPSWHTKDFGDFNGDGKADILWQNDDGTPAVWLMNGLSVSSGANVGFNPGPSWHVVAAADFNGDGRADILWQNADGTPAIWLMNGTGLIAGASLFNPGPSWHVIGAGDFNGDGKADILWQNSNGQAAIWLINGLALVSGANAGSNPGAAWQIQAAGDFNGDGKADILMQNVNGQPAIWEMNGQNVVAAANVGFNPGAAWQIHAAADFNGDGKADIEWQNTDGTPAVWLMNGFNVISGSNVGFDPGANWHLTPGHDTLA